MSKKLVTREQLRKVIASSGDINLSEEDMHKKMTRILNCELIDTRLKCDCETDPYGGFICQGSPGEPTVQNRCSLVDSEDSHD